MDIIIESIEDIMEITLEAIRKASTLPKLIRPKINIFGWGQLQTLYNLLVELDQLLEQKDNMQPIALNKSKLKDFFLNADCFMSDIELYSSRAADIHNLQAEDQLEYLEKSYSLKSVIILLRKAVMSDNLFKNKKELYATIA